jgi:hypothetical protein
MSFLAIVFAGLISLLWGNAAKADSKEAPAFRSLPRPLANHPGNIFLQTEDVTVLVPPSLPREWKLIDYDRKVMAVAKVEDGKVSLGRLPVGYYELRPQNAADVLTNRLSVGVLAPLKVPTPSTSPIGLDVALAWFFKEREMAPVINLAALAGVNWVRDRYSWMEMEPSAQQFSAPNRYDYSVRAQSEAGFQVLEVNHYSPLWANTNQIRFPTDLRDTYRLHRALAVRWKGSVHAFEPWNEADIEVFGNHIGSEISSFQKAAYLGVKAGNPDALVCQSVFASHNPMLLDDLGKNETAPYFDTFNLHHYIDPAYYGSVYADFRRANAGRPLWVSECNFPAHWSGDDKLEELTDADLRAQAERVAKVYATSLYQGAGNVFYFTLAHYAEFQNQFGILRRDLTPRPAYLSLATVGRLLVDAVPIGKVVAPDPSRQAYLFRTKADGNDREILVAWNDRGNDTLDLPVTPLEATDLLGRPLPPPSKTLKLGTAPSFSILKPGAAKSFKLETAPRSEKVEPGKPSPVVFQAFWPEAQTSTSQSAYRIPVRKPVTIPIFAYNLSTNPVSGEIRIDFPSSWKVTCPTSLDLQPMDRKPMSVSVDIQEDFFKELKRLRIGGDFGKNGRATLSLAIRPEAAQLPTDRTVVPIANADTPARWTPFVSGNTPAEVATSKEGITVAAQPKTDNRWVYPRFEIEPNSRVTNRVDALQVSLTLLEGSGQFRAIFEEENGSSYMVDFNEQPKPGQTVEATALVEQAAWGATWSMPDPNA